MKFRIAGYALRDLLTLATVSPIHMPDVWLSLTDAGELIAQMLFDRDLQVRASVQVIEAEAGKTFRGVAIKTRTLSSFTAIDFGQVFEVEVKGDRVRFAADDGTAAACYSSLADSPGDSIHRLADSPGRRQLGDKRAPVEVDAAALLDALRFAGGAMARGTGGRLEIERLYMRFDGKALEVAATDGKRLHVIGRPDVAPTGMTCAHPTFVKALCCALDLITRSARVTLDLADRAAPFAVVVRNQITIELLGGEGVWSIPRYDQVFPPGPVVLKAQVSVRGMVAKLRQVKPASEAETEFGVWPVRLSSRSTMAFGAISIAADRHHDWGSLQVIVPATVSGGEMLMRINGRYLLEAFERLPADEAIIEWYGDLTPLLIRSASDPRCVALIMPMRMPGQ